MRFGATLVAACVLVAAAGCSRRRAPVAAGPIPPTVPSTAPATAAAEKDAPEAPGKFDRPDLGLRLVLPQGWVRRPSEDYELVLRPAKAPDDAAAPAVSLDVPDLPAHIPGMIPIGSVRKGYLDDLRKSVGGDMKTTDLTPPSVPGSAERMVRSAWTDSKGEKWQETALMLVHADRVYIFRARSKASDEAAAREAFDAVVRSLEWTKKPSPKGSSKSTGK